MKTVLKVVVSSLLSLGSLVVLNSCSVGSAATNTVNSIIVSTQMTDNQNIVPSGMHAPIFVNWSSPPVNTSATVTLTSSNPNLLYFYYYNESGIKSTSSSVKCVLNSANIATQNCGFGVEVASGVSSGSVSINSSVISSDRSLVGVLQALNLNIAPPKSPVRSIVFSNNSDKDIWIGITQGSANAYISPTKTLGASNSQNPAAHNTPGGGSFCGVQNNNQSACPIGSSCRPGGASGTGPSFCYWDTLVPNNSQYVMSANGGTTTVNISASSGDPSGIIWSGNFFARSNCNESGVCEVGSCGNSTSGLVCANGTGPSPGVVTLGEFTFQRNTTTQNPDYYDVSIINGVNVALAFGPDQTINPFDSSNAYICGTAGSFDDMGTWPSSSGLPQSVWLMNPNGDTVYPFDGSVTDADRYYRWVDGGSGSLCTSNSDCTLPEQCGYHLNTVYNNESGINQGATNSNYNQYCGHRLAWLTADSIAGFGNATGFNNTPAASVFNLNQSWANPVSGGQTVYVTNLQLCNINTFSSFQSPAPSGDAGNSILACGGSLWNSGNYNLTRGETGFALTTINQNWIDNVQPTIGWLKRGCPTCYTYPFDDATSTFTCNPKTDGNGNVVYKAEFRNLAEII